MPVLPFAQVHACIEPAWQIIGPPVLDAVVVVAVEVVVDDDVEVVPPPDPEVSTVDEQAAKRMVAMP